MIQALRLMRWILVAAVLAATLSACHRNDPEARAKRIQLQLAAVRGMPYKRPVSIEVQPRDEYLEGLQATNNKAELHPASEDVLRLLGLLASNETLNLAAVNEQPITEDSAVYYDENSGTLRMLQMEQGAVREELLARELYTALQDQYFDLKRYVHADGLDADQRLARQAVVSGDNTYVLLQWGVKQQAGRLATAEQISRVLDKRGELPDVETLRAMNDDPRMRAALGGDGRVEAGDPNAPPAFVEHLRKALAHGGALFVNSVRGDDRRAVERAYNEAAPDSTSQVLHPGKWRSHARPLTIRWPAFDTEPAFADWEPLDQGVMGELMWRVVFRTQRLSEVWTPDPRGWNGDRYAAFKRRNGDGLLVLIYTAWDTEADAKAFAAAYEIVAKEKYRQHPQPTRLINKGRAVVIVEGAEEAALDQFVKFAAAAEEVAPASAGPE